jgi:putative methyltransferase (TIGR04325 family)
MNKNGFFGIYKDFDELREEVPGAKSYDLEDWVNKQVSRLGSLNDGIDIINVRNDLLIENIKPNMKVLDVGGSLGTSWVSVKDVENIKYTIVENKMIVDAGRKHIPNIDFFTEVPTDTVYDIVYIRTSLQYMDDWKSTLYDITENRNKTLLFKHTALGDFPTFATIQNWYGHEIPYWFINFNEFNDILIERGYELTMKRDCESFKDSKDHWDSIQNYPEKYRIDKTLDIKYELRN